ncbi:hypothetical protein DBV15_07221, partial [Temnothorax longispinosus]
MRSACTSHLSKLISVSRDRGYHAWANRFLDSFTLDLMHDTCDLSRQRVDILQQRIIQRYAARCSDVIRKDACVGCPSLRVPFIIIGMMGLSFDYSENKLRERVSYITATLWEINFAE